MPISNQRERRIAPRLKTFEPAELAGPDGTRQRVHLLNISATGALAYGHAAPAKGAVVTVHGAFEFGQARVAWSRGKSFGLAFLRPLCGQQIDRIVDAQRILVESSLRRGLQHG